MSKDKERAKKQLAWYPTIAHEKKLNELKKQLMVESSSALMQRAVGELYNRTFPNKSWM